MIPDVPVFDILPKIVGHRGACGHAPENTLASLKKSAELGAGFVEIDVTLTRDNIAVIQHDTDVKRCSNGSGPILLKTLAEVKSLDAGSWFSPDFTGERIPTLKEATGTLARLKLGLNLEIKPTKGWEVPTAEQVGRELLDYWPGDLPLLLSSFNIEALVTVGEMLPGVPRGYLTEAIPPDWERRLAEAGCASLHCEKYFVTEDKVAAIRKAGYRILVYTVNDPEMAKRFLDWGVDAIITDFPDRMLDKLH
ncbi:MAG: glycerophosphoryl diester phosphodiesterase [Sneathiella sp.]|nr:glycerophosphoryl diester phosphodiesterase [Sneathiella sp.]